MRFPRWALWSLPGLPSGATSTASCWCRPQLASRRRVMCSLSPKFKKRLEICLCVCAHVCLCMGLICWVAESVHKFDEPSVLLLCGNVCTLQVCSQEGGDWGWRREHSWKGASAPQLAWEGVWEKVWNYLRDKRPLFRGARGERFLPCVPTEGRALPKQVPETGASCGYQLEPQRQAWNANTDAAATKNPMCKHRSLSTHAPNPESLWSPPLPKSLDPGTTSLGEHTACLRLVQCHASLCYQRLTPHSSYDYHTPPSHQPEWARVA